MEIYVSIVLASFLLEFLGKTATGRPTSDDTMQKFTKFCMEYKNDPNLCHCDFTGKTLRNLRYEFSIESRHHRAKLIRVEVWHRGENSSREIPTECTDIAHGNSVSMNCWTNFNTDSNGTTDLTEWFNREEHFRIRIRPAIWKRHRLTRMGTADCGSMTATVMTPFERAVHKARLFFERQQQLRIQRRKTRHSGHHIHRRLHQEQYRCMRNERKLNLTAISTDLRYCTKSDCSISENAVDIGACVSLDARRNCKVKSYLLLPVQRNNRTQLLDNLIIRECTHRDSQRL